MTGSAIVTRDLGRTPGDGSGRAQAWLPLVEACLRERRWLETKSRIWVALSGGADSTALLRALLNAGLSAPIFVTHVDHGVQQESRRWAAHCLALGEALDVPVTVHSATPPADGQFTGGFEAWARAARYNHWGELLQANEVLLCAHHADDQAETVALRLLQGRLPLPIPARRALGAGVLWRPFLGLRASQLRDALAASGHVWLEDPSNNDTSLLRNEVRNLLPQLEQLTKLESQPGHKSGIGERPYWGESLRRCGALVVRLQAALQSKLGSTHGFELTGAVSDAGAGELGRVPLAALPGQVALQGVLALFGSGPVSHRQARDALIRLREQAAAGDEGGAARGGVRIGRPVTARAHKQVKKIGGKPVLSPELRLFVDAADIVIWREPHFAPVALAGHGREEIRLPHGTLVVEFGHTVSVQPIASEANSLAGVSPVFVRPLVAADRLLHNARSRRVKELLRGSGVPRWARASYPVVAAGGLILAVPAPSVPVSGAPPSARGWLADGGIPQVPIRVRWLPNLPS